MRVDKSEVLRAIEVLKKQGNPTMDVINVVSALQYIADNANGNEVNLFDRNAYFASILWHEIDVREEMLQRGIDATEEAVSEVLKRIDVDSMEDCSDAWEYIYIAIEEYMKDLEKEER